MALVTLCVLVGLFYGAVWTLLPPFIFLYFLIPLGFLALTVIWALPDRDIAPSKWVVTLLFTYMLGSILWPNYLALQIAGLPWISMRRLIGIPLLLIFLVSYSTSPRLRDSLGAIMAAAKPMAIAMLTLILLQILTLVFSNNIPASVNYIIKFWLEITSMFFVSAWVLSDQKNAKRFFNLLIAAALILCVLAGLEWNNKGVIWANHIPFFLQVQDSDLIARFLTSNVRDGRYRVIGTYPVSLSLAECLAIVTPFVIHKIMKGGSLARIALWIVADLMLLAAIEVTQSRLGTLGWLIAHAAYGCFWGFNRWNRVKADLIGPAIALIYPVGALLFFIGMFTVPAIRNRTIGGGSTGMSDQSRLDQLAMMWPKLFGNPIGHGGGQSGTVLGYRDPGGLTTVDSFVITILMDYGIIGLVCFGVLLIYPVWKLVQIAWKSDDGANDLALPLACAFLVAVEVRFVLSQIDNLGLIFILAGAAAGIIYRARVLSRDQAESGDPAIRRRPATVSH